MGRRIEPNSSVSGFALDGMNNRRKEIIDGIGDSLLEGEEEEGKRR